MPVTVSDGSGICSFFAGAMLKFWMMAVATKNSAFRANVSPAHTRLPAPNGIDLSSFGQNCPDSSKNRSGINSFGRCQAVSSLWDACSDENTIVPCSKQHSVFEKKKKKLDSFMKIRNLPLEYRSPWMLYRRWLCAAIQMEQVFRDEAIHVLLPHCTVNWNAAKYSMKIICFSNDSKDETNLSKRTNENYSNFSYLIRSLSVGKRLLPTTLSISFWHFFNISGWR